MRTAIAADDPDDFDAQLRAAHRHLDLFAAASEEPDPAPAAPKAAKPAPLPSGGYVPEAGPPSPDVIFRAAVRAAKGEGRPRGDLARYIDEGNGSSVGFRIN